MSGIHTFLASVMVRYWIFSAIYIVVLRPISSGENFFVICTVGFIAVWRPFSILPHCSGKGNHAIIFEKGLKVMPFIISWHEICTSDKDELLLLIFYLKTES